MLAPTPFIAASSTRCFRAVGEPWALPVDAMSGYLRHAPAPAQVILVRLPACVAAKQNGFWQIVD